MKLKDDGVKVEVDPVMTGKIGPIVAKERYIVTTRNNAGEEVEVLRVALEPGEKLPPNENKKLGVYKVKQGVHASAASLDNAGTLETIKPLEQIVERHNVNLILDVKQGGTVSGSLQDLVDNLKAQGK